VIGVVVRAIPGRARPAQLGFFEPPGPSPDKLATTLARLAALVGNHRVGAPALVDKHEPGAFKVIPFNPAKAESRKPKAEIARALVLHAMRPARDAEVHLDRGRPRYVQASGVAGQVLAAAGPFRLREGWWEKNLQRDYYDIELSDGAVYRLYQDLVEKSWFLEGWYE
jgi:protein ImuB